MTKLKTVASVADILERELQPTITEWLRQVNLVPELTAIPLTDADRTGHLPKLYHDLISRLRLAKGAFSPISVAAAEHGEVRRAQGYSAAMLIEESRVFPGRHIRRITSPSERTGSEPLAFRRNGHRGRGGCTTQGSRAQLDGGSLEISGN